MILNVLIAVVLVFVLFGFGYWAIQEQEITECLSWARNPQPLNQYAAWQLEQCKAHNIDL